MSFLFNHGWWNPERDEQHFLGADRRDPRRRRTIDGTGARRSDSDLGTVAVATKTAPVTERRPR